jgi:hypothetical protein
MKLSEGTIFKNWLLMFGAGVIGGGIIGAVAGGVTGAVIGFVMGMQPADLPTIRQSAKIPAMVVASMLSMPWQYFCYRWTVLRMTRDSAQSANG